MFTETEKEIIQKTWQESEMQGAQLAETWQFAEGLYASVLNLHGQPALYLGKEDVVHSAQTAALAARDGELTFLNIELAMMMVPATWLVGQFEKHLPAERAKRFRENIEGVKRQIMSEISKRVLQ